MCVCFFPWCVTLCRAVGMCAGLHGLPRGARRPVHPGHEDLRFRHEDRPGVVLVGSMYHEERQSTVDIVLFSEETRCGALPCTALCCAALCSYLLCCAVPRFTALLVWAALSCGFPESVVRCYGLCWLCFVLLCPVLCYAPRCFALIALPALPCFAVAAAVA